MQVQQVTELNISGTNQAESNRAAKSNAVNAHDGKQKNSFEDHLNKQLDRSNTSDKNKKSISKQEDKGNDEGQIQTEESASEAYGASEAQQPESEVAPAGGETETAEITENKDTPETMTVHGLINDEAEMATEELPVSGNALPLGGEIVDGEDMLIAQQAKTADSKNGKVSTESLITSGSSAKQAPVNTAESVSRSVNSQLVANSEVAVDKNAAYKAATSQEGGDIRSARFISEMDEVPVTELVNKATRLQQVPLTTAVSASSTGTQNVNTTGLNIMPENISTSNSLNLGSHNLGSGITTHIQNPMWSQKMTDQVSFMLRGGYQQAEIKLNPANLGPMEIKLSINDDQASVSFITQHAPVRDAIDSAMPRLREMLEQQGLNLADVNVSTKSQQQGSDGGSGHAAHNPESVDEENASMSMHNEIKQGAVNIELDSGVSIYA